jgi:hypothetical protein
MKQEEINENNKLIAEFAGFHPSEDPIMKNKGFYVRNNGEIFKLNEMRYHSSWDWLMPVVEEIENIGYVYNTKFGACCIANDHGKTIVTFEGYSSMNINTIYELVIKFIKWYNENK